MDQRPFYEDDPPDSYESVAADLADTFSSGERRVIETMIALSAQRCRDLGVDFGVNRADYGRIRFETDLSEQLARMEDAVVGLPEECIAAFDQAAWDVWDLAQEG